MPFSALAFVSYPWLADNLAVRGLQVESELAGMVLADFELRRNHISFGSSRA
jgi:hypothetical protein